MVTAGSDTSKQSSFSELSAFQKMFFVGSINVLAASTILWALLGALAQHSNADQLINPYLFDNAATFHGSLIPSAHTFLLKWPLFWLIKMLGYSSAAYIGTTIGICLVTVGSVAFIAYRLMRRPLPFAVLCLAFSALLLPIPAQPYAGALLPVNMAMLTTRNLEYVVYIVVLLQVAKMPRIRVIPPRNYFPPSCPNLPKSYCRITDTPVRFWKIVTRKLSRREGREVNSWGHTSWRLWLSILLLGLLIASDRLFMPLALGGACVAWLAYTALHNRRLASMCQRWLVVGLAGSALSYAILYVAGMFVHITGGGSASPYGVVHSLHDLLMGVVYAAMHIFTNIGANPAFDATQISQIPSRLFVHLISWSGLAFVVNIGIGVLAMYTIYRYILGLRKNPKPPPQISPAANCFSSVNVAEAMLPSEKTVFARGDLGWVHAILRKSSILGLRKTSVSRSPIERILGLAPKPNLFNSVPDKSFESGKPVGMGWFLIIRTWVSRRVMRGEGCDGEVSISALPANLAWSGIVAIAIFVLTNHYYPADARYLGIVMFAIVFALALYLRDHNWVIARLAPVSFILIIGVTAGVYAAWGNYQQEASAMAAINNRNAQVAAAMQGYAGHSILLGDYWRVIPARQSGKNSFSVLPLSDCTQARQVLSSTAWQPDLSKQPFAYLYSLDSQTPDFPKCSLQQITNKYGMPNASTVIAGTHDSPQEMLLFYDRGTNSNPQEAKTASATTISPTALDKLAPPVCNGKTVLSVVAHQDDDLLFMNPDQLHSLQSGDCLRTIYVTAGDAGNDDAYWLGREKGAQKAYSYMSGRSEKDVWIQQTVKLSTRQYITIASPMGNPNISLIFMRLPDGNPSGTGFERTRLESLAKLDSGEISNITSVDGQSAYQKDEVVGALTKLMDFYQPGVIRAQLPEVINDGPQDHSDHLAVGRYTRIAHQQHLLASAGSSIRYYLGYPMFSLEPNVAGQDYDDKSQAFFTYSVHDSSGCTSHSACDDTSVYGNYIRRQYAYDLIGQ
jgi:LmbE family N-acetylglucosaminyl deacetylase